MSYQSQTLTTSISRIYTQQPFFAVLLTDLLHVVESPGIDTIGTNEHTIIVNPEWFDGLEVEEGVFILAHEILHTVYKHFTRGQRWAAQGVGPDFKRFQMKRWNKACDYVVNYTLSEAGIGSMPMGALTHPSVDNDTTIEDVYCRLPEEDEDDDDDENENENENENGDNSDSAGGFDEHQKPQAGQSPSQAKIDRSLNQAADASKAQGNGLSGPLSRMVEEITNPKVDWREVLREFMVDTMGRDETTWNRLNRRRLAMAPHIPFPGTKGNRSGNIAVVLDTSGSISDKELSEFLGEVSGILGECPPELCKLYWTHTSVHKVDEVDEDTDLNSLSSGESGGTDMQAGLKTAEEDMPDCDAIIVITDGYTEFDDVAPVNVPVMWVMTTDRVSPYGTNIRLE